MPRPRKTTRESFYDCFADFELADQEIVLEFLAELHRQAKRQATKKWFGVKTPDAEELAAIVRGETDAEASARGVA